MTEDILDLYLSSNSGNECALQYHRWAFISCVAACLGRRVSFKFGHKPLYPTMYIVLVGLPASRKSTAIDIAETLLRASGYDTFAFTKTSREKFLLDLNEGFNGRTDTGELDLKAALDVDQVATARCRECFICADELLDFIGMKNFNFLNTLTTLWDNKEYYPERLKNSVSVNIPRPTINMLGGFTPQNLSLAIPAEMIGQGATSRFIFVHSAKPKRRITFPKDMRADAKDAVVKFLHNLHEMEGECELTEEAEVLIDKIYQNFGELPDARLHHYASRRLIHLLKLCMVLSAVRGTLIISEEIVEQANTILSYTEHSMSHALGEFGDGKNAKATQKIMEVLQAADGPLSLHELWARVTQDIDKVTTLAEILQNLSNAKKIIKADTDDGETSFILNRALGKANMTGVNYEKWIRELRDKS